MARHCNNGYLGAVFARVVLAPCNVSLRFPFRCNWQLDVQLLGSGMDGAVFVFSLSVCQGSTVSMCFFFWSGAGVQGFRHLGKSAGLHCSFPK